MKVAVIGAGKLGLKITEALLGGDNEVTLIDKNGALLDKISGQLDLLTVTANAKQISVLKELEIHTYDYLVAVTDNDEKNIVISCFAKKLGCPKTIARIRDPEHVNQINFIKDAMNIDHIVNPDLSISNEIYKYLVEKYTLSDGFFSSGNVGLTEFKVVKLPIMIGKPIKEITKMLDNMLVVAVSRFGKIIVPHGETVIEETDGVYVIGEKNTVSNLNSIVHEDLIYTDLKKVMIVGGGKTGFYLAKKLSEFRIAVKIIEIDKTRCQYLSEHLDDVLVLNGDATDTNLLQDENLDDMDAFVTTTGYDEENLMLALMAKQHNIEDVIAKVSRKSYAGLTERLGIDMALNPLDIISSNILRFIQGSKRVITSQLIQGQAEMIEIVAVEGMKLLNTTLDKLDLPDGIILAAIHRDSEVIIPNGTTMIKKGDRVVIFALLSYVPDLEHLLRFKKKGLFK